MMGVNNMRIKYHQITWNSTYFMTANRKKKAHGIVGVNNNSHTFEGMKVDICAKSKKKVFLDSHSGTPCVWLHSH